LGSLSEYHPYATARPVADVSRRTINHDAPLPRFVPLRRFPATGSHIPPVETHLLRLCCALRVSHPLDALLPPRPAGLISSRIRPWGLPLEAFSLRWCRTPSRTPSPHGVPRSLAEAEDITPPGYSHHRKPARRSMALTTKPPSCASLGSALSKASCPPPHADTVICSPLSRFLASVRKRTSASAPQGFNGFERSPSLSRRT
jgi:hypothetical protein